jgi:NADPH:quinone reductase-like Zn-dependent oxidoreductase
MIAAIFKKYGSPEVIKIVDVPRPTLKDNQLLIRVYASSVNSGDARIRRADPWLVRLVYGLFVPKHQILGIVFAGEVVEVGQKVTKFKIGQKLYGLNENTLGSCAQFVAINENNPMGMIPTQMSFQEAAALAFGATTALSFLDQLNLEGKTILLNGASGAVGTNIIQIATNRKSIVTAVTSSKNQNLVKSLGAVNTLDYTSCDLDTCTEEFDIVIDCINNLGMDQIQKYAKKGGTIVLIAGMVKELILAKQKIKKAIAIVATAKVTNQQYESINKMYVNSTLKPVIDKVLPLEEIVEAHRIVDSGRKVGSIVITVD